MNTAGKVVLTGLVAGVALTVMASVFPPAEAGKFLSVVVIWSLCSFAIKSIWN